MDEELLNKRALEFLSESGGWLILHENPNSVTEEVGSIPSLQTFRRLEAKGLVSITNKQTIPSFIVVTIHVNKLNL